jgi:hypothetical protein
MMIDTIPEFKEYKNHSRVLNHLLDIQEFSLVVEIPPINGWKDDKFSSNVMDKLYDNLIEVVRAAKFYYEDQLSTSTEVDGIKVTYSDDRYPFSVECNVNYIIIRRRGCRFPNFHDWYKAFMPSAQSVINNAVTILSAETGRSILPLRASHRFKFLIYDIRSTETDDKVRNTEIVQKLLKVFPDDSGHLADPITEPEVLASMGRLDVNLIRWIGSKDNRRRLRFSVEAPGNLNYSTLWFTFEYAGESYTSPDEYNLREAFNPDVFLTEHSQAYVSFLRDGAINKFMEGLLRGYNFKSSAGQLP